MKKMFLLTIIVSLFCLGNKNAGANDLFARPAIMPYAVEVSIEMNDWILETSTGNVDLYYQISLCDGQKVIFLMFVNHNDFEVEVAWKEVIQDRVTRDQVTGFYGEKKVVLAPGQVLQSDCFSTNCQECITRSVDIAPTHLVEVEGFVFSEISVNTR